MSKLVKHLPLELIQRLSKDRSQQFYVSGIPLPESPFNPDEGEQSSGNSQTCPAADNLQSKANSTALQTSILESLAPLERRVVVHLCSLPIPIASQQEIIRSLNITSGSVLNRIQKRLVTFGLVRLHRLQSGKNFHVYWESTEESFTMFNIKQSVHNGIGGNLHAWICQNVKGSLTILGWSVAQEFRLNDGSLVDLVARKEDQLVCFEVGLPPLTKEIGNSLKCFSSELKPTGIVHLVTSSKDRVELERHLRSNELLSPSIGSLIQVRLAYDCMHLQTARAP